MPRLPAATSELVLVDCQPRPMPTALCWRDARLARLAMACDAARP